VGVAVYLPLLAAVLLGVTAPLLVRLLPPATATRALSASAVLVAASTSFVLGVLAFTLLGKLPLVASMGRWSVASFSAADPVPQLVAVGACIAVLVLGITGLRAGIARIRALSAARALCQRVGGEARQLVVVEGGPEDVYALPGARGRIFASRSLLTALPADERRALLAHEAAHLRQHHHVYRICTELAAAVNPLLRPVAQAVRFGTERWADEQAAVDTGDRRTVARALAHVGLRRHEAADEPGWRSVALDAAQSAVAARVQALLSPPPRRRPTALLGLAVLVVVTVCSTVDAQRDAEQLFEQSRPPVGGSVLATTHQL
jgi:Zn-dependent protease with chaperone function